VTRLQLPDLLHLEIQAPLAVQLLIKAEVVVVPILQVLEQLVVTAKVFGVSQLQEVAAAGSMGLVELVVEVPQKVDPIH
jgi:hypothetical protein